MSGFIRYQFISYLRSLKIIPPVTLFIVWVILFYTYKGVPILSSFAITSIAIYLVITWITMNIFSIEEENEKHILFTHLGSKQHYLWGKWAVCFIISFVLILFAIIYPILMNNFKGTILLGHLSLSIYSHIFLAIFGILIGSFFSITAMAGKKYAWLSAILVIVVSISYEGIVEKFNFFKWALILFPPVYNVNKYLSGNDTVRIDNDFWFQMAWVIAYIIIILVLTIKMYLKKEG